MRKVVGLGRGAGQSGVSTLGEADKGRNLGST